MPAVRKSGLCLVTVIVMFNCLMAVSGQSTADGDLNQYCDWNSERDRASIIAEIRAAKVDESSIIEEIKAVAVKVDDLMKTQDSAGACTNQPSQGLPSASSLSVDNCIPQLIQQNIDGSDFFNRSWEEYKVGFNRSNGDFWLGNEMLHQLTKDGKYKLRIDIQQIGGGVWWWAEYTRFFVLSEAVKYQISVGGYTGNTGYDALAYHDTMYFSTWDRDNDIYSGVNCAGSLGGGFWFNGCRYCGVNTMRSTRGYIWYVPPNNTISLGTTRMWLTCR